MKNSILLLLIFASFSVLSQSETPVDSTSTSDLSMFFILDRAWSPNSPKRFNTDSSPNYIQIFNTEAVICARSRNQSIFMEGEINSFEQISEIEQTTTKFYIRGRNRSAGKLVSVEIIETIDEEITIHVFQKLGSYDKLFSAHPASQEEINQIAEYWAAQEE